MTDPYTVLGVKRTAADDEIKKAYRNLSRRYHPDANINNPNKDQAEAKFKEVQQAYDQIMHEREYGSSADSSAEGYDPFGGFYDYGPFRGFNARYRQADSSSGSGDSEESLHLQAAANFINSGHFREALNLLNNISLRNGLWYYYSALANSGIGSNVIALNHAREAVRLEPDNFQYRMLLNRLERGGMWYQGQQGSYQTTFNTGSNWCLKLCIANLCCNLCCNGLYCGGGGMPGGYI